MILARLDLLTVEDATGATGSRELRVTTDEPAGARLDQREARELYEALGDWLERVGG